LNTREIRWHLEVLFTVVCCSAGVGLALIVGPARWTSSRSLSVIREYSHVPWPLFGALFLVCAVLLTSWRTRLLGYVVLAFVVGVFVACSCLYTLLPGDTTNVIVAGFSPLIVLMLCAGVRYALRARRLHQLARSGGRR
jgi:hypothetical protein